MNIIFIVVVLWLVVFVGTVVRTLTRKDSITLKNLLPFWEIISLKPVLSIIIALVVLAGFLYSNSTFSELIGINKSLSDRGNGVYCYYVEAKELETNKEYTVPAKIVVDSWDDDVDGKRVIRFNYYIEQLFFDDGTSIIFEDYEDASFTSYTGYLDEKGKEWACKLTEHHAYNKAVQETSHISILSVIELCLVVFVILFNLIGSLYLAEKEKRNNDYFR